MKLSTKGRYGVRAMFDLALYQGDGPIPLRSIAERQGISENYLEQLVATLRNEGLVNSVRGAHGGYLLAKKAEEITVGDIIRALEGPIALSDCVTEDIESECENNDGCVVKLIWQQVKENIDEVLDSITLEDIRQEAINAKQNGEQHGYMYHI
ncbi:rrf2 family protein, putative transcriptional regulator [Halobacteroides halobius DSM 5150]|uniref:Rrf2 family protein, putative transcriptional regulator n=1 Tax=Halobacteroides halobius (strain ATCC 35273 / DSM 5150 / MD-1) TaxID=748449 RepID=L0K9N9_HALHC|nr:Rrf2 family transcriptional regulator [Halobacteroides halobius]AGB41731.1 rrf2 family protein, putative transcriptional regulator [Halobacteroides halobius DSM 5150]